MPRWSGSQNVDWIFFIFSVAIFDTIFVGLLQRADAEGLLPRNELDFLGCGIDLHISKGRAVKEKGHPSRLAGTRECKRRIRKAFIRSIRDDMTRVAESCAATRASFHLASGFTCLPKRAGIHELEKCFLQNPSSNAKGGLVAQWQRPWECSTRLFVMPDRVRRSAYLCLVQRPGLSGSCES